jgi:hypothetical protein
MFSDLENIPTNTIARVKPIDIRPATQPFFIAARQVSGVSSLS